jgi:hypothetical protein
MLYSLQFLGTVDVSKILFIEWFTFKVVVFHITVLIFLLEYVKTCYLEKLYLMHSQRQKKMYIWNKSEQWWHLQEKSFKWPLVVALRKSVLHL